MYEGVYCRFLSVWLPGDGSVIDVCRYFRIIFIHLIPCTLLVGLNTRLFVAMRRAQAQHRRLLRDNLHSDTRRLTDTNMATLMLLVVVGVFLLVELPLAVMMMTMIVENTSFDSLVLIDPGVRSTATLLINVIILFSYPVNFFIYCGMSQQFRQTFCQLFACGTGGASAGVLGAPTEPSRCPDDDRDGDDGGAGDVVSRQIPALLTIEPVHDRDQSDDHEAFSMTPILNRQQQTI